MMAKGDHVIELWEASIFFKTRNQIARTVLPRHCQWLVPWVPTYQLSRASSRRARLSERPFPLPAIQNGYRS